jgi:hypothetical protein
MVRLQWRLKLTTEANNRTWRMMRFSRQSSTMEFETVDWSTIVGTVQASVVNSKKFEILATMRHSSKFNFSSPSQHFDFKFAIYVVGHRVLPTIECLHSKAILKFWKNY